MDRKFIALIIVIVIIIAGAAYVLAGQNSNIPSVAVNNSSGATKDTSSITPTKNQTNTSVKISAAQAQQIAVQAAEELGGQKVKAGTPVLFKWTKNTKHIWAWNVPLTYVSNGKDAGAMYVDAITGTVIMNE